MQFDLRKFIATGTQPYHAEFPCDLSARDFAGARIEQPVTASFTAEPDGDEVRMTLRAKALVHGECARCLDRLSGKRQLKRSGQQRSGIWMTRISSFRWTKKDIWMWMNGLPRSLCSRSPRCCFAAPTARGYAPGAARRGQIVPARRRKTKPLLLTQGSRSSNHC